MTTNLAEALATYRAQLRPGTPTRGRSRARRWTIVALVTAVLAGGALAVLLPGDPTPPPGGAPTGPVTGTAPAPSSTPTGAADPAAGAAAPVAAWRAWSSPVVSTWLPTIPGAGPADLTGVAGFTRTPGGALAAAANLHPLIYYTRDRGLWSGLADHRVVWADGQREQLTAALDAVWDTPVEQATFELVGYRQVSFTPERAQVRLWWSWAIPGRDVSVVGALVTVLWTGGDWVLWFDEPGMDMRPAQASDSWLVWGRP